MEKQAMTEPRQFQTFMPTWIKWVRKRSKIWSHIHVAGLLLWNRRCWSNVATTISLADSNIDTSEKSLDLFWPNQVRAFRLSISIGELGRLMLGLKSGRLSGGVFPNIPEGIEFQGVGTRRLEPYGEAGILSADRYQTRQPENRWPRFVIELHAERLNAILGQEAFKWMTDLDERLSGSGKGTLGELARLIGARSQDESASNLWTRETSIRLVAPLLVAIQGTHWDDVQERLMCTVASGQFVDRSRIRVVLQDPERTGFFEPVCLPEGPSPVSVSLGAKPTGGAEIRLAFDGGVVDTDRFPSVDRSAEPSDLDLTGGIGPRVSRPYRPSEEPFHLPGGWKLVQELQSGGQAEVILVERDGIRGVLKRVRSDRSGDARLERLRREVEFLRNLEGASPFIVQMLDGSKDSSSDPFLVTPYASLRTTHDCASMYHGDAWRVLRAARDIALALAVVHEKGFIHRDVKPKNILVFAPDVVALADFGVAYDASRTHLTSTKEYVESEWFSPPECHDFNSRPQPTHDVFMLGRVIYYLLSGGKKSRAVPATPAGNWGLGDVLYGSTTAHIESLLGKMLSENVSERFSCMTDVIRGIDRTLARVYGGGVDPECCTACGRSGLGDGFPLRVVGGKLLITKPDGMQVQLGEEKLFLRACPACGHAMLNLAASERNAVAEK